MMRQAPPSRCLKVRRTSSGVGQLMVRAGLHLHHIISFVPFSLSLSHYSAKTLGPPIQLNPCRYKHAIMRMLCTTDRLDETI